MKKLWLVELLIWIMVLSLVSGSVMLVRYLHRKQYNSYEIFLPDIDGVINGSPVRYMGIEVGYINQLNIVGEEVYIRFVVNNKDFTLPKGSVATVSFTGLGGSKSLEIYPPEEQAGLGDSYIIAQAPKRLGDSLGLFMDMFDEVSEISYEISSFMKEVNLIKKDDKNAHPQKDFGDFLNVTNNWLDDVMDHKKLKFKEEHKQDKEAVVNE